MGLRGCCIRFPNGLPSHEAMKERAESLGGLPLVHDAATREMAFALVPGRVIDLSDNPRERNLFITDQQQASPVLFVLLVRAAKDLGGETPYAGESQPATLTPEYVEKEYRRYVRAGYGVALIILGALLVVLLLLAGFVWAAWHAIGGLFG